MAGSPATALHLLLSQSPLAWLLVDAEGGVRGASAAARRLLGPVDDRPLRDFFRLPTEAWPPGERILEAATCSGPPRWCRLALSPTGEGDSLLVQVEDLTALRPVEPSRGPNVSALSMLARVAHFGLWFWDLRSGTLEWTPELRTIFGVPEGANPDLDAFVATIHEDDRERMVQMLGEIQAGAPHEQVEFRIRRRSDGAVRRLRASGTVVERDQGRPIRMAGLTQDLTDEPGLEEIRIRYEALFHGLPVGLYRSAPSGELLDANPEFARLVGRDDPHDLIGTDVHELFVDPRDRDRWCDIMERDGSVVGFEMRLRAADGQELWVRDSARTVRDASGRVAYYEGLLEDVTPERMAQQAVERSEERLRALLRHATEGFSIVDLEGKVRFSSRSVERLLGFTRDEWESDTLFRYVHPDDLPAARRDFAAVAGMPNASASTELRLRHGDGGYRTIRVVAHNLLHDPAIRGIVLNTRDVTDERAVETAIRSREQELRASQRFLNATLDAMPEHIAILDGEGVIQAVNRAWRCFADANGWGEGTYGIGMSYLAVTEAGARGGADQAAEVGAGLRQVLDGRRATFYSEYPCHAPEEHRWFSLTISSFELDGGIHAVVAHENITARRELEEQLRHAQKMDAVGLLAGGIAHDFNNLMTSVLGHASLVLDGDNLTAEQREELEAIRGSGERAAALTQHLLAFSRKQVLQPRTMDLNQVLVGMDGMLQRLLGQDIIVRVDTAPELGSVRADPNQLEQVVLNLALNARDAMAAGGTLRLGTAAVQVPEGGHSGALAPGAWVSLRVEDTGHGMSADVVERIFEPFFTTKPAGTGLGLSTVYGIVKQSGGEEEVHTRPGAGSVFEIFLPRVDEPPAAAVEERSQKEDGRTRGTETILVVEDEDAVRDFAVRALRRKGYEVLSAEGGEAALRLMRERDAPVSLLLTDVVMPEMSGPELVRRLGAEETDLPVIFTSGYTEDQVINRGAAGSIHFLPKPFSPAELARKVREVLDEEGGARD